jgi:hypothetical protein
MDQKRQRNSIGAKTKQEINLICEMIKDSDDCYKLLIRHAETIEEANKYRLAYWQSKEKLYGKNEKIK